jgi:hypothetical protein|tara:strand:- start:3630 stop:4310 length:681 start_codon:yes stop_codon:yes gene_type:complete
MAKISSYQSGAPEGSDLLIGTDVSTGQTKNFSVNAVGSLVRDSATSWQFKVSDSEGIPEKSSIYFPSFGGNNTLFSNITELMITPKMANNTNSLPYLQSLLSTEIIIQDTSNLGSFGVFTFNTLVLDGISSNYKMSLSFISGSGGVTFNQYYGIQLDLSQNSDKTFVYDQVTPSNTWEIVHNLNKFPSVTVVDTANSTVEGAIEYNSNQKVTITFSAIFAGKAYLN